jgi:transcription-repair coupling factor (superfamily II helicase)
MQMLEDKVKQLKTSPQSPSVSQEKEAPSLTKKISIDLNIEAFIEDKYFSCETDKINFYREIESLNSLEDMKNIVSDFEKINKPLDKSSSNFFKLLKLKLISKKYNISSIKKL